MKTLKFIFLSFALLLGGKALAADQVTVKGEGGKDDVTVAPGKEFVIEIHLSNTTTTFTADFSTNIYLPDGFDFNGTPTPTSRTNFSGETVNLNDKGTYQTLVLSNSTTSYLSAGSGAIVSIPLKVTTAAAQTDPYVINVKNFRLWDEDLIDEVKFPDMTINVYVKESTTVDITLANASGYNSYCCDKDLDVSGVTDAKFYVVSSITASEATLTQVTTGIPAGEGFLIEGSGTANISVPVAATTPTATGSKLVGVTTATSIEAGNYILKSDGSSFVPCTAGTLPANKAYLKKDDVPATAKEFLMIVEDAVVTGINEVQAENSVNGPIYNLNGARVSNPQKGVYIMNGRKVIVK